MVDQWDTHSTVPLQPDRDYDQPGGPHEGHAAALNVPCSEGPAEMELDQSKVSHSELMAQEPRIEPGRQMEAGTEYDEDTLRRLSPLFTPIHPEHNFD